MIDVLPVGTKVTVGTDIPGVITAVFLRADKVAYEVAWWNGRDRKAECLEPCEITTDGPATPMRIGFTAAP